MYKHIIRYPQCYIIRQQNSRDGTSDFPSHPERHILTSFLLQFVVDIYQAFSLRAMGGEAKVENCKVGRTSLFEVQ